jgi:hypothetical protein
LEAIEAIEMIAAPKHKHHQDVNNRGNREYWRREKALDEALKNTFMSAFGGKADMALCGNSLSRSLLGVKRTCLIALHMSAFDPKRT